MNDLRRFIPRALVFLAVFAVVAPCSEAHDRCKAAQGTGPWYAIIYCDNVAKCYTKTRKNKTDAVNDARNYCLSHTQSCSNCRWEIFEGFPKLTSRGDARFTAVATCGAYQESATAATEAAARRQATRKLRRTLRACGVKAVCECHCITVAISQSLTLALPQCDP